MTLQEPATESFLRERTARFVADLRAAFEFDEDAHRRDANGRWASKDGASVDELAKDPEIKAAFNHVENVHGDQAMNVLARQLGKDGLPAVATDPAKLIADGWQPMWRGVTNPEIGETMRTGEYRAGQGIRGNGFYFAEDYSYVNASTGREGTLTGHDQAARYTDENYIFGNPTPTSGGGITAGFLSPDAKVADMAELADKWQAEYEKRTSAIGITDEERDKWRGGVDDPERIAFQKSWPKELQDWHALTSDLGRYAMVEGFDAVRYSAGIVNVLNREAMAMMPDPEWPKTTTASAFGYDPDQPRDEKGRFGEKDGGGATPDEVMARLSENPERLERFSDHGDPVIDAIARLRGFDAQPRPVLGAEDRQAMIDEGWTPIYRGVRDPEFGEAMRTGDYAVGNGSLMGNGFYFTSDRETAGGYAGEPSTSGDVTEAFLPPYANVIDIADLRYEWSQEPGGLSSGYRDPSTRTEIETLIGGDIGRYAALKGYDAISQEIIGGETYINLLNRGAAAMWKDGGEALTADGFDESLHPRDEKGRFGSKGNDGESYQAILADPRLAHMLSNADAAWEVFKESGDFGNGQTNAIAAVRGFDALPAVATDPEALVAAGWIPMYRGVDNGKYSEQMRTGGYMPGTGNYGAGYYFSTKHETAVNYAGWGNAAQEKGENPDITNGYLSPDAKVIGSKELESMWEAEDLERTAEKELTGDEDHYDGWREVTADGGSYAALLGYDAIRVETNDSRIAKDETYYVVLNRGATAMAQGALTAAAAFAFDESAHPRDERGRFGEKADLVEAALADPLVAAYVANKDTPYHIANTAPHGDPVLDAVMHAIGKDGPPPVADDPEALMAAGYTPVYRGVRDTEIGESMRTGDYQAGEGVYGNGFYFSTSPVEARGYTETGAKTIDPETGARVFFNKDPDVTAGFLSPDAKVVGLSDLRREWLKDRDALRADDPKETSPKTQDWVALTGDMGRYAALKGYDAVVTSAPPGPSLQEGRHYLVLNREVVPMVRHAVTASGFDEDAHPRDAAGRWASKDGGGYEERLSKVMDDPRTKEFLNDYMMRSADERRDFLNVVADHVGFTGIPPVATDPQALIDAGYKPIFRGNAQPEFGESMRTGEYRAGEGIFGNGFYFSTWVSTADRFATKNSADGDVTNGFLPPDAKIVTASDLKIEWGEENHARGAAMDGPPEAAAAFVQWRELTSDMGIYAALRGYDALIAGGGGGETYLNVLNRSIIPMVEGAPPVRESLRSSGDLRERTARFVQNLRAVFGFDEEAHPRDAQGRWASKDGEAVNIIDVTKDPVIAELLANRDPEYPAVMVRAAFGDPALDAVMQAIGKDNPPAVATDPEALIAAGYIPMYRGVPDPAIGEAMRTGGYASGQGVTGNGYYFSTEIEHARGYTYPSDATGPLDLPNPDGDITVGYLSPDAKVISNDDLRKEWREEQNAVAEATGAEKYGEAKDWPKEYSDWYALTSDEGRYAALRGYDAIIRDIGYEDHPMAFYVVLNREATAMAQVPYEPYVPEAIRGGATFDFDPSQPRDETGRWASDGGGSLIDEVKNDREKVEIEMARVGDKILGVAEGAEVTRAMSRVYKSAIVGTITATMKSSTVDIIRAGQGQTDGRLFDHTGPGWEHAQRELQERDGIPPRSEEILAHLADPANGYMVRIPGGRNIYDDEVPAHWIKSLDDLEPAARRGYGPGYVSAGDPEVETALRTEAVSGLVHQWAETSNDHSPESLAIQRAAEDEFGLTGVAPWTDTTPSFNEMVDERYAASGTVYRDFVRAQYDETQARLASLGIEHVDLARGYAWERDPPQWAQTATQELVDGRGVVNDGFVAEVPLRPLSSWTSSPEVADWFTGVDGVTGMHASLITWDRVPAERIFSTAGTGVGCLNEKEFVILGGTDSVVATNVRGIEAFDELAPLPIAASATPDVDDATRNEDWLKTSYWDLPTDAKAFAPGELERLAKLPAGEAMPSHLKALVASGFDEDLHPRDEHGRFAGSDGRMSDEKAQEALTAFTEKGGSFQTGGDAVPGGYNGFYQAEIDGTKVGYLDYQMVTDRRYDDGSVTIAMVEVDKDSQGQGVAAALVAKLQTDLPDRTIDWGYTTGDGTKLREALLAAAIGDYFETLHAFGWDPDQPRDEAGRFGEKTGSASYEELMDSPAIRKMLDADWSRSNPRDVQTAIARLRGFTAPPAPITDPQRLRDAGWKEVFRGVNDAKWGEAMRTGNYSPGSGMMGNGFYFAEDRRVADRYAGDHWGDKGTPPDVTQGFIPPDAKIIDLADVHAQWGEEKSEREASAPSARNMDDKIEGMRLPAGEATASGYNHAAYEERMKWEDLTSGPGIYATLKGYDAIREPKSGFYLILNRAGMAMGPAPLADLAASGFDEEAHPRDEKGRFEDGNGSESDAATAAAARSVWTHEPLFHATSAAAARSIREDGFQLPDRPQRGADYGKAIYLSADEDFASGYGSTVLSISLTPDAKILDLTMAWTEGLIDRSYQFMKADEVRALADKHGFDGVSDGDVVAVFDPDKLRVSGAVAASGFEEEAHPRDATGRWAPKDGSDTPTDVPAPEVLGKVPATKADAEAWVKANGPAAQEYSDFVRHWSNLDTDAGAIGRAALDGATPEGRYLAKALDAAPLVGAPLYRGCVLEQRLTVGDSFSLAPSSFSLDRDHAAGYASAEDPTVLTVVDEDLRGLPVLGLSAWDEIEKEYITGGNYEVIAAKVDEHGTQHATLRPVIQ